MLPLDHRLRKMSEEYEEVIESKDIKVPRWLVWTYIILPIWGIYCLYAYWNGSHGWLDRGYWKELQQAANTTYPLKYPKGY